MVIICTNDKGLRSLMLHAECHPNLPSGSWKEDFKSVLPYMDGSHLGHVTCKMLMYFHQLVHTSLHSKFG